MTHRLHQRTIDEMKASIEAMLCVTDYHEDDILDEWGKAMGWIPCKQEGDV